MPISRGMPRAANKHFRTGAGKGNPTVYSKQSIVMACAAAAKAAAPYIQGVPAPGTPLAPGTEAPVKAHSWKTSC